MRQDLGRLRVEKVIVHDVPQKLSGTPHAVTLSDVESPLDTGLRVFFQDRIKASLASTAFNVVFDPACDSPTPELVLDHLGAQTTGFVRMSRQLATHLDSIQTGVNSAGILTAVEGSIEGQLCIAILKLEREAGLSLQQSDVGGLVTFNIEHIRSLMLTDKTKVFKAGVFVQDGSSLDSITGLVSDLQRGPTPRTEVAGFFLRGFLGCRLREAPDVTTKRFFVESQAFINQKVDDPVQKTRYMFALVSTLNDNQRNIRPRHFAEQHLIGSDREQYIDFLEAAEVPTRTIEKDITLVMPQLRKTRWDFESGIALIGPPESFDEHVTIENLNDGETRTLITDRLTRAG